jgi:hypothetical protein
MKTIRLIILALAVALTSLQPGRSHAQDDAALEAFKKEMLALEAYTKEQEAAVKANPMGGIAMIRNIVTKLKSVKTDGLPADLKAGYGEFVAIISKMGDLFNGWPEKAEDMQAFIVKKMGEDPKFMDAFGEKMVALEKEMKPAIEKLDGLGKKYGFEGLNKLAPGGEAK